MSNDIDRAQARPASDGAQICRMCDGPIPEARRQALPDVLTCIECQRDIERLGMSDWGMAE